MEDVRYSREDTSTKSKMLAERLKFGIGATKINVAFVSLEVVAQRCSVKKVF